MPEEKNIKVFYPNQDQFKDIDTAKHEVSVIWSSSNIDTDSDILKADGYDKSEYMKRPVLLLRHDRFSTLETQAGKALDVWKDGEYLWARLKYNVGMGIKEIDYAAFLAEDKMAAYSHWFKPKEIIRPRETNPADPIDRIVNKWTNKEISHVHFGANEDAVSPKELAESLDEFMIKNQTRLNELINPEHIAKLIDIKVREILTLELLTAKIKEVATM